jgi:hypothetical protein
MNRLTDAKLDALVKSGTIKGYRYSNIEDEPKSGMREHEDLILVFPDGNKLRISAFCSGSAENTILSFQTRIQQKQGETLDD